MRDDIRAERLCAIASECQPLLDECSVIGWDEDKRNPEEGLPDDCTHATYYAHRWQHHYGDRSAAPAPDYTAEGATSESRCAPVGQPASCRRRHSEREAAVGQLAQVSEQIDFAIRPAREDEIPLGAVRLVSLRQAGAAQALRQRLDRLAVPRRCGDAKLFYRMHHRLVDELLPRSAVLVASLRRMPDEGIGFAVFEGRSSTTCSLRLTRVGPVLAVSSRCTPRCSTASRVTPDGRVAAVPQWLLVVEAKAPGT
jgi:hypothetical protein